MDTSCLPVDVRSAVRMPVFEADLPVNIARKAKTVRRVLGELPLLGSLGCIDFEHDDLLTACREHGYRTEYRVFLRLRRCDLTLTERPSGGVTLWRLTRAAAYRAVEWYSPTSAVD